MRCNGFVPSSWFAVAEGAVGGQGLAAPLEAGPTGSVEGGRTGSVGMGSPSEGSIENPFMMSPLTVAMCLFSVSDKI